MNGKGRLLVIVGATAVGKTSCSLELAGLLNGEVVSADSRYLYRGMDIGTAKPSEEEMANVRHHLIDVTNPDAPWSLARYVRAASRAIESIHRRGTLPIVVGGTGQYVKAILEGWKIPPRPEDESLRCKLQNIARKPGGERVLLKRLAKVDPKTAETIDRRNVRRVIRALEVSLFTGRPFSEQRVKNPPPYKVFVMGLTMTQERLYGRIDARIDAMLRAGWVDEVRGLLKRGYYWNLPAMSALGYRQIGAHLNGEIDLLEAKCRIGKASRRLVRRQRSWFRTEDETIHWYDAEGSDLLSIKKDIVRWSTSTQLVPARGSVTKSES